MANKALGIGKDSVLQWFQTNAEQPYYSVWNGRQILFSNNDDDFDKAVLKLDENIASAEQNGYNDVMILKLHPKKEKSGFVTDKTPTIASFTFRPAELQPSSYIMPYQPKTDDSLILSKLNGIEQRLNDIESDEDEDEQPQGTFGAIMNNVLQNETMQQALIGFLGNILTKFTNNQPQQNSVMAIAGINDTQDEKIAKAIEVLKQHDNQLGDDLILLSNLAVTNLSQFNFLLTMLRK